MGGTFVNDQGPSSADSSQRVLWCAFACGVGIASWAIPVIALVLHAPMQLFGLSAGVAVTLSLGAFLAGALYTTQRRAAQHRDETARRVDTQLTDLTQAVNDQRMMINETIAVLGARIDRVAEQVLQENFNALGNAYIDLMGGPHQVGETPTGSIPEARVYQLPHQLARANRRDQAHDRPPGRTDEPARKPR